MMLDYKGYLNRGGTMTETQFKSTLGSVMPLFDEVTCHRRQLPEWNSLEDMFGAAIADAQMLLVERQPTIEKSKSRQSDNGGLASFSNGITSMSFSDGETGSYTVAETRAMDDISALLPIDLISRVGGTW